MSGNDTADTESTVRLEHLTWPEVEEAIRSGTRTAVIGVGSIEQHGPHLPLVIVNYQPTSPE